MSEQTIYTVSDVARILKLSTITVYKFIRDQKLEAIEFGGHYRISQLSLNKFILDHTIPVRTINNTSDGKAKDKKGVRA